MKLERSGFINRGLRSESCNGRDGREGQPQIVQIAGLCYIPGVIFNSRTRRRRFGTVCLLAAIAMLVAGESVLEARLSGVPFIIYWVICFVFTFSAIFAALVDARALRQEGRQKQRELLETTLGRIEREKSGRN